jgi:hypothetical protein
MNIQPIETLVKRYERSPIIRALVQLIPLSIGSAVDTALLTHIQNLRAERARIFFDELERGAVSLQPELLQNNEFLHCYFATVSAALRTHRDEKIQAFARLLRSATIDGKLKIIDEYEEFLGILDDMSFREVALLSMLDHWELKHPYQLDENDLQRANRFWEGFIQQAENDLSILPDEMDAVLFRLGRTGCYELFTGSFFDDTGGKGKTTPLFQRLKTLVFSNEG